MIDIRRQFALPTGMVGRAIGHLMAVKNRERSEWVLGQLEIASDDTILEVGFGRGADIRRAGGGVAIAVQPRQKGADEESARHIVRKMIDALYASGFEQVRLTFQELRPVPVACALATR